MSKKSAYFWVDDLSKEAQVKDVKQGLNSVHGIISVSYSADTSTLAVDFDTTGTDTETIEKKLQTLGYEVSLKNDENHVM